jgi:hypothetical protein
MKRRTKFILVAGAEGHGFVSPEPGDAIGLNLSVVGGESATFWL